ncbi:MAG: zinc ABC transporter substrate-binding protein [Candidatus Peregrinibacteria bacterium]|nr:zinc ABC transporter substrate-binding protein [Candidatus Peregrinibacteria bacterium]
MKKFIAISVLFLSLAGCGNSAPELIDAEKSDKKLTIVTTLFPVYDFAKSVGGDIAEVTLLVPPGTEPHEYEPTASDIININNADVFAYTGDFMEKWVFGILSSVTNKNLEVVDMSEGTEIVEGDPHIWLDFEHDRIMVKNIADAIIKKDPKNKTYYEKNLGDLLLKIDKIDYDYKMTISSCKSKEIVYGGHYAFGYLVRRFGLGYIAAQGLSPDSEPTVKDLIELTNQVKKNGVEYIFYEGLASPKVAETISNETGAKMLLLNNLESLPRDEIENGKTFIDAMYENLDNIKIGLDCK